MRAYKREWIALTDLLNERLCDDAGEELCDEKVDGYWAY